MTINQPLKRSANLLTLLVLSLTFSASAQAALEVLEDAYELRTEQILRWPLRAGDSLVVRPCHGCDITSLRVTDETRYSAGFDAPSISLRDLLHKKSLLQNNAEHLVIVFFRPDDLQVTRIIWQTNF